MEISIIPPALGILGMVMAFIVYRLVMKYPDGEDKVKKIGDQIHSGALAFMKTEYKYLSMFIAVIVLLAWYALGPYTAISIIVGAICSSVAGFIGMYAATKANVRTATAAQKDGPAAALSVSFYGGSIMGLCVASLGLIGLGGLYYFYIPAEIDPHKLEGFAMGASVVALFSRVGGGIFTKSADVGADLVGKIEAGIPEDDPRNPGVIADNVGDNVGDVAGMGSDIFESYCGSMIASIAIAYTLGNQDMMMLPLALTATGLIASIIGIFIVKLQSAKAPASALRSGTLLAPVIFVAMAYFIINFFDGVGMNVWWCVIAGAVGGVLIGLITEYYTGGNPVKKIAESGETGSATVMISGLSVGMQSVVIPIAILAGIILTSTQLSGIYGVGIAAVGMLATVGITMAIDAYGPVADNAGGIAEMSDLPEEVRTTTDALDAVGNTTKAVTKGYAIGSAGLAALVLFAAYTEDLKYYFPNLDVKFALQDPYVVVGLFIGGMLPYLFGSMGMQAVGRAAGSLVEEVRRQFREKPGIMEGTEKPEYGRAVDLLTKAAIKEMVIPSLLPVLAPIIMYFVIMWIGGQAAAFTSIGAMLLGTIVTGIFVAISMTAGGGAWDNAKKYIEDGNHGGKGSDAHKAAVTGDTVGDPYKDTAGPAVNPMIKIINIVAILLLAALAA